MQIVRDQVAVRVPASAAGLGSGGPRVALALGISDTFVVRAATKTMLKDDAFTRALLAGLEAFGAPLCRPEISRTARIPISRGLGDWAAHTVAGLGAASLMLGSPADFDILGMATSLAANRTQAQASLEGGCIIGQLRAEPPTWLELTLFIPDFGPPDGTREVLPSAVRFEQVAKANIAAVSLGAIMAGAGEPADLMAATEDHVQLMRAGAAAPASTALVNWLRDCEVPAALAGVGSAVVAFEAVPMGVAASAKASGWRVVQTSVDRAGLQQVGEANQT